MTQPISKRILILDDDARARTAFGHFLNDEGYDVALAGDGLEAISLHRQKPFDLVIIELLLAGHDGFETFAELQRTSRPPKLIAIAKPGWISAEMNLNIARQLGARETLAKPFNPGDLLAAVRRVLAMN